MQAQDDISNKTPREILEKFYADNHLDSDGGQSKPYVRIDINPSFHFYIPNFNERRKAVIKHDMHHLLTGYETNMAGETEISMWEVASGCKKYRAALAIDVSGAMMGFLFNFPRLLKSFARGRRTGNLYHDKYTTEQALDMRVGELRKEFKLDQYPKYTQPTFADVILFLVFCFFGGIYSILSLALLPLVVIFSIYVEIKLKFKTQTA
jgi:ubiquinone biosynthesis protein Coq4